MRREVRGHADITAVLAIAWGRPVVLMAHTALRLFFGDVPDLRVEDFSQTARLSRGRESRERARLSAAFLQTLLRAARRTGT